MPVADSSFGAVYSSMEDEWWGTSFQKINSKTNNKKK
jgi:hypothetical protein